MNRADQIRTILRRYGLRSHYIASQASIRPAGDGKHYTRQAMYALWADGEQITQPDSHRETQRRRESLIVHDLLAMIDQFPADPAQTPPQADGQ